MTKRRAPAETAKKIIGIIGGTGLYRFEGLEAVRERRVKTPFGAPSDAIIEGRLGDATLLFLPRHGRGHRHIPSSIPFRANVFALKALGAQWILSVSAVGSLKEDIHPGDLVIVDQFIDRTWNRPSTFFDRGPAVHVQFADPVCRALAAVLHEAGKREGLRVHMGGTYCCMEGPAFSTRAESNLHRQWGAHLIGMTNLPEAKLAREAEICYATIAVVTDYDCWRSADADVNIEDILKNLMAGTDSAKKVIRRAVGAIGHPRTCACADSLRMAVVTSGKLLPPKLRKDLRPLIGRYL
jgi:5'-methylthioadenosine phosphorylase